MKCLSYPDRTVGSEDLRVEVLEEDLLVVPGADLLVAAQVVVP